MGEYNRLSKEDGDKPESDSIQNQHSINNQKHLEYLREQGEQIESVTVYSDDGYAGGNFKRPRYQALIRDIESGKINCIIFKDNSRLGRNYPELGRLMEDYFPQKGVRVISVLNNLDSVKDPRGYCSAIVSFSNIVNDDYIRQLSIKIKCTLTMKRERGEFIGKLCAVRLSERTLPIGTGSSWTRNRRRSCGRYLTGTRMECPPARLQNA